MGQSTKEFLLKNGVDAATAAKVDQLMSSMMQGRPDQFLLAAQLAVAAASGGSLRLGGATRFYEGWPCKWYVPELDSDSSAMVVQRLAASLAALG